MSDPLTVLKGLVMSDASLIQAKLASLTLDAPDSIDTIDLSIRQKRADTSKALLASLMTKDTGETGKFLTSLLNTVNNVSPGEEKTSILSRWLGKGKNKIELIKQQYRSVESNIQQLENNLRQRAEIHRDDGIRAEKRIEDIRSFYTEERLNLQAMEQFIENSEKKRAELEQSLDTNDPLAVATLKKFDSSLALARRKRDDIQDTLAALSQDLMTQEGIKDNILALFRGIHDALFSQLTEYRNLFADTLSIERSSETVRQLDAVAESTNNLRQKRAEMLNQATRQVAQHQQRGTIDLDRLIKAQEAMKETIIHVRQIQQDGEQKRAADLKRLQAAQEDYHKTIAQQDSTSLNAPR
ncbi:hypothetical protein GS537_01215 [Saccharibacter sp. EH60]|nr:hypothetical protein [Saccharibacter sp. EH60]